MSEITLTTENFKEEVLERKGLILVDFWADWCGPCKMLSPVLKEIADEYQGKITIGKVNVDENMDLAMGYRVVSIPMVMLFQDGKPVAKSVGYVPKEEIIGLFKSLIG